MPCLSPIGGAVPPYFEKYLNPPEKKNVVCITLCDRVYFLGYIVNIQEHKIIHIDSLRWDQLKNTTTAKMVFENSKPPVESLSSERKQFYAYSCGVWLVDGMSSYLINLSETFDRYNAFDITYNLLEQNLLSEKLKACPHSFLLKIRWKKLPLWIS